MQTVLRFVGLPAAGLTSPSEAVRTPLPWRQLNGSEPFAKLIPCATLRRLALFFNRPNAELYRVMNDTEHGRGTADPLEPPFPPFDEASFFSKNMFHKCISGKWQARRNRADAARKHTAKHRNAAPTRALPAAMRRNHTQNTRRSAPSLCVEPGVLNVGVERSRHLDSRKHFIIIHERCKTPCARHLEQQRKG